MPIWSRRPSAIAVLQQTYNEAYENSLQSILKESNFEYEASLASWNITLQGITNGMAALDNSPLRTAQEMSLMSSIRDIERQCNERMEFLRTKLYNPDMATNPYRSGAGYGVSSSGSIRGARSVPRVAVGSKTQSEESVRAANASMPASHQKSASEGNFHPMPSVSDMPYGMYRAKQSAITKTLQQLQINSNDGYASSGVSSVSTSPGSIHAPATVPATAPATAPVSTPAPPPVQRTMLKTLRSGKNDRQKKASNQPASNAATAAWKNPSANNTNAILQAAREKQERQQEIILRTAKQAVSSRDSNGRLKRSPQSDHLAQFSGFEDTFVDELGSRDGSQSPELLGAQRSASPQLQAKPRTTNRYVVTTSHINSKRTHASRPSPPPSRNAKPSPPAPTKAAPAAQAPTSKAPAAPKASTAPPSSTGDEELDEWDIMAREKIKDLRGVDENAAMQILSEVVLKGDPVHWGDIAGLDRAKASLKETVVYPFLRPDLFSGLREPALGMLLFGPPGTGKTMLARAVATESKSTFFSISASSLTSKYMGESEKLVRALFQMAKALAPSIIFVDEIDSILTQRADSGEHEASRRIKNEFLVQWSDLQAAAAGKNSSENLRRVLVLGATNLPWAIDEAARRRFVRRQYIPLPEAETRKQHLEKLLSHQKHALTPEDIDVLVEKTEGYSGSDVTALAKDAAMGPLRALGEDLLTTDPDQIRSMNISDFEESMKTIKPSVSPEGLKAFEQWAALYGSSGA